MSEHISLKKGKSMKSLSYDEVDHLSWQLKMVVYKIEG